MDVYYIVGKMLVDVIRTCNGYLMLLSGTSLFLYYCHQTTAEMSVCSVPYKQR